MSFRPVVGEKITILNEEYIFTRHPSARNMPYGQTGRRATVYQVKHTNGELYGLKIFTKAFRSLQNEKNAKRILEFSTIPGLQVCSRTVLTAENSEALINMHPDLDYAVFMPWIYGQTWQEMMLQRQPLPSSECYAKSLYLASTLSTMEQYHIAHCDLSSPNLLLTTSGISLVDVEDMYIPDLPKPYFVPTGSMGYGHKTSQQGLWAENADRFAGGILLAELLCWCNPKIPVAAYGESYFLPTELQTETSRFRLMVETLKTYGDTDLVGLFDQTWNSLSLDDCPSLSDWYSTLQTKVVPSDYYSNSLPRIPVIYGPPIQAVPKSSTPSPKGPSHYRASSPSTFPWTPIIWCVVLSVFFFLIVAAVLFVITFINTLIGY